MAVSGWTRACASRGGPQRRISTGIRGISRHRRGQRRHRRRPVPPALQRQLRLCPEAVSLPRGHLVEQHVHLGTSRINGSVVGMALYERESRSRRGAETVAYMLTSRVIPPGRAKNGGW